MCKMEGQTLIHNQCAGSGLTTRSCTETISAARTKLTPPINKWLLAILASPMPWWWSQIACIKIWRKCGSLLLLLLSLCYVLASCLHVHSLPKVHATGSTMRLVSRVRRCRTDMRSLSPAITTMALCEHDTTLQCRAQFLFLLLEILLIVRNGTDGFCRDLGGCDLGHSSPLQLYFHSR